MSKLKCQLKSKCLDNKTYPANLVAPPTATVQITTPGTSRSFCHLIFDIDLTFRFCNLTFYGSQQKFSVHFERKSIRKILTQRFPFYPFGKTS